MELCYYTVNIEGGKFMLVYITSRQRTLLVQGAKIVAGIDFKGLKVINTTGRGYTLNSALYGHVKDVFNNNTKDLTNYDSFGISPLDLAKIKDDVFFKIMSEKEKQKLDVAYGKISEVIRKEKRIPQLNNILELVEYFTSLSFAQQDDFIYKNIVR